MVELNDLKKLTLELAEEIQGNVHAGPLFGLLTEYFDGISTYIQIVRSDKTILYMNKALKNRLIELGIKPDGFINNKCPGGDPRCPLKDNCPIDTCVKSKNIISHSNVRSPLDNREFTVVCLPLIYNGVSSVIEMWTKEAT